jgi:hypothetical protein
VHYRDGKAHSIASVVKECENKKSGIFDGFKTLYGSLVAEAGES